MTATLTLQSNAAMHHNWRIGFRQTAAMSKRSVLALWR